MKNTIKVRPILVETKEASELYLHKTKGLVKLAPVKHDPGVYGGSNQQLILISLEKENIVVGDKIYSTLYGLGEIIRDYGGVDSERNRPLIAKFENSTTQQSYHRNGVWQKGEYEEVSAHNCRKVIATQSQLSPEYIQQFIAEYNKANVEDFEIEMEEILGDEGIIKITFNESDYRPKFTNGFITIVEKDNSDKTKLQIEFEKQTPSIKGVRANEYLATYCAWLELQIEKQPIQYTEEEVEKIVTKSYNYGAAQMGYYLSHKIPAVDTIDKWFEENKKKK